MIYSNLYWHFQLQKHINTPTQTTLNHSSLKKFSRNIFDWFISLKKGGFTPFTF